RLALPFFRQDSCKVSAFQVKVKRMSFRTYLSADSRTPFLISAELRTNACADITSDFALHLEQVRNGTVVHAGPQVLVASCVNQLRGNSQLVSCFHYRALDNRLHSQRSGNLPDGLGPAFVVHYGCS